MKTYNDILFQLTHDLAAQGLEENCAKQILANVLKLSGAAFFLSLHKEAEPLKEKEIFEIAQRYIKGEPLQYIFGYTYFYGLKFKVNPSVLIPRFDSEILVETVVKQQPEIKSFIDIGTGSGCLAIALAKQLPSCRAIASDISQSALLIAKQNAIDNGVEVEFVESDMFEKLSGNYHVDMIISNPPYIASDDLQLNERVKQSEPQLALIAAENGYQYYRIILNNALTILNLPGRIVFEVGSNQANCVIKLAQQILKRPIKTRVIKDINGLDRVVEISISELVIK